MKFTKMQGIGNDYVYINCFEETVKDPGYLARLVSDRHYGIGSDGLILICPSDEADCQMRMFNADGSESEMCGNGIRCVAKYAFDHKIVNRPEFSIETKAGIKKVTVRQETEQAGTAAGKLPESRTESAASNAGQIGFVTVDMGIPEVTGEVPEPIVIGGREYEFIGISVGNPHAVYYMDAIGGLDLETMGPAFENHERFPNRTNSEFVEVVDRSHVKMRVWERGSGETYACGTGATACAVASMLSGRTENTVDVKLLGGTLTIHWDRESGHVYMTGPAAEVFCGEFEERNLGVR